MTQLTHYSFFFQDYQGPGRCHRGQAVEEGGSDHPGWIFYEHLLHGGKRLVFLPQVIDDDTGELNKYYYKLGQYYESIKEYQMAQRFYMQGNMAKRAIEMYNKAGMWEEAHQLAQRYMDAEEVREKSCFGRHRC